MWSTDFWSRHRQARCLPHKATEFSTPACSSGPDGVVGTYRKVHLPFLGVDRFTTPGDQPFAVHEAAGMRIGMNICYDGGFPEPARVLTLLGADLVVLPTNWPPGAECMAGCVVNARAMENNIFYAACDRVGDERGFHFIGQSKIAGPSGQVLAEAAHDREAILYAQIDVAAARQKRIVREGEAARNRSHPRPPARVLWGDCAAKAGMNAKNPP